MSMPNILVDADACPVVRQIEAAARRYGLPITLLCDEHHIISSIMPGCAMCPPVLTQWISP